MIIDHTNALYKRKRNNIVGKYNGAYYYSKRIVKDIIPNIQTDRNWITINVPNVGVDHSIVFIHNNKNPFCYDWLKAYDDMVLVCGIEETMPKVQEYGRPIYLPLSVDVDYVKQFEQPKTKKRAYVGRAGKRHGLILPEGTDLIENMPRPMLLSQMAMYEEVYAVGLTAIEAKVLGCRILSYDPRYPNPDVWKVYDTKDIIPLLQEQLDGIDYE